MVIVTFLAGNSQVNNCGYIDGVVWLVIEDDSIAPIKNGHFATHDEKFNKILKEYKCKKYTQVFPYSKIDHLQKVYKVIFDGKSDDFLKEIKKNKIKKIKKTIKRPIEKHIALYEPNDNLWELGYLWHLEKIQTDLAWDITKGNPSVKIAIIDTWFDVTHPDLSQKISPSYDPFDGEPYYASGQKNNHGTTVASFAAAHTDGGGELASVGFNSTIIAYKAWGLEDGEYIEKAQHASLVMNADVLTSSAGGWRCGGDTIYEERLAVQEILDNGTAIVMPAGNGVHPDATNCKPLGETQEQPWFPLHPIYDERIIIVSSTDINDNHTYIDNGENKTHSHYPEVDLCAPGYSVMGAKSTINDDGTTCTWPYFGECIGTSFATPIVAGVCALMKAVNPDLTPSQIQTILKATTDPITDASQYPGLVGTGRVNAYKAVSIANCDFSVLPTPTILGSTTVCSSSNTTYTINNLPSGATVTWTKSSNLSYVSKGTNTYTVKAISSSVSGSGWVQAEISIGTCDPITIRKDFNVGSPLRPYIRSGTTIKTTSTVSYNLTYGSSTTSLQLLYVDQSGSSLSSNYITQITSGSDNFQLVDNGTHVIINPTDIGTGSFIVKSENQCGIGSSYTTVNLTITSSNNTGDPGGPIELPHLPTDFSISPNPANEYLTVIIDEDETKATTVNSRSSGAKYIVQIWNSSVMVKEVQSNKHAINIPISNLTAGTYYIRIIINGQASSRIFFKL